MISSADEEHDQPRGSTGISEGQGVPPVVAVMVASRPGEWFEETLESLAESTYENLAVLVIDNADSDDLAERIAPILPSAFVKRVATGMGFAAAANEALRSVEGAAFYLFLHDDVALGPGALSEMVVEAFRSNSGIVGPKLVDWDETDRLASVGIRVDPFGFASQISEPGELDQSQHDSPRPVFAVSDACMLVRADLFATLGGFDPTIPFYGEDIDLCWRAHIAGASVDFCPSAVVAHRQRFGERRPFENVQRLEIRHHARAMLKNYSLGRLLRVVPVAFLLSVVDLLASALLGHFQRSADIASAWFWNLIHAPSLWKARASTRRVRTVPDRSYVVLMRQGSSRLRGLFRGIEGENRLQTLAASGRGYLREAASRSRRLGVLLMIVTVALLLYGGRGLILGHLPALRELPMLGRSSSGMLGEWLSGWRPTGLGEPAVAPGAVPLGGLLGWSLFGSLGAARRLLILGPLVIGSLGAWKLLNRSGSTAARAAMLAVYSLNPVVLNALATGRAQALAVFAAAPWLLRRAAVGAGLEPFASGDEGIDSADASGSGSRPVDLVRVAAGAALIVAAVAVLSPLGALILVDVLLVTGVVVAVLAERKAGLRIIGLALIGLLAAALVGAPWLYSALRSGDGATLTGLFHSAVRSPSAAQVITGSVGPVRTGVLGWGLVMAALFGLAVGRSWRLTLSLAAWVLALGSWTVAVVLARSGFFGGAGLELVLMPAVLAVALAIALGVLGFERDVLGTDFGAGQILAGVAALGLVVGLLPIGVASLDGRWYQPAGDFGSVLDPVDTGHDFRTVWIGDPDVLPVAGWSLGHDDLVVGTSLGLDPTLSERYRSAGGPGIRVLTEALRTAVEGRSSRLGRILAPMGVKYVIVVDRPVPVPYSPPQVAMPTDVVSALRSQVDLSPIEVNPAMVTFRVNGTWPLRSDISATPGVDRDLATLRSQLWEDPGVPPSVLGRAYRTRVRGELKAGAVVFPATSADPGWRLTVDGRTARRSDWRGWGQKFTTPAAGRATLRFRPPPTFRLLQALSTLAALLLAAAALGLGVGRRGARIRRLTGAPSDDPRVLSVGPLPTTESGSSDSGGSDDG